MKYTKPPLSFPEQAEKLIRRGLNADRDELIRCLSDVNYYRLSAYWYPFRLADTETLAPGTTLDVVWNRYVFDRQLRVHVMDAIERIEVGVKTRLVNALVMKIGPFGYLDRNHLPNISVESHRRLLEKVRKEADRSKETFIHHYLRKYSSETDLPLWMAVEIMDFGSMLSLFKGSDQYTKREVANAYGISAKVLESWLLTLNYVRNLCAHHGRLWNRTMPVAPLLPDMGNRPEFHNPTTIPGNKTFTVLCILRYLIGVIAPKSGWGQRLVRLWTEKHPEMPLGDMGFPDQWTEYSLWNQSDVL
jgi:abortive infection bacteriophage resistance protein